MARKAKPRGMEGSWSTICAIDVKEEENAE